MRVVWVNKSFSDYRVPVYVELDKILDGNFSIIFSGDHTHGRVQKKIKSALGARAIALKGEHIILRKGDLKSDFANVYAEITYQPGLYHAIKENKPDVIIGEGFFKWTFTAFMYRIFHGTPLVVSYERTHHTERKSQWYRTLYRKAVMKYINAICCNGSLSAEYSHWLGMPENRIITGSMAADSEELHRNCEAISFEERQAFRESLKLNKLVFLYIGQLVERKGVRELLASWEKVQSYGIKDIISLVIVGEGPERANLEEFAKDKTIGNVHFIGGVNYDSIAQYYAMADVFVMPTLEDNWSLVVPEAMVCGLPIICSIYNGCWPELIKKDVNGFTIDPYKIEEISRTIKYFVDYQDRIPKMGESSRQIVADYSLVNAAKAIYNACIIAYQDKLKALGK